MNKFSGGPGSGVEGNNTKKIEMPMSEYISIGKRKEFMNDSKTKKEEIPLEYIKKVSQEKYVPAKIEKMKKNWEEVKDLPFDVLKVSETEYHVIDGHHRYLRHSEEGTKKVKVISHFITKDVKDSKYLGRLSSLLVRRGESEKELDAKIKNNKHKDERPDSDYDKKQLKDGADIEKEHTDNVEHAKTIAKDHLDEYSSYYKELKKMEKKLENEKTASHQKHLIENENDLESFRSETALEPCKNMKVASKTSEEYMDTFNKNILLDLDNTIHDMGKYSHEEIDGKPLDGAKEFLDKLKKDGYKLFILSARSHGEDFESHVKPLIEKWMKKHNLPFDEIVDKKIPAFVFLDDRCIRFNNDYESAYNDIINFKPYQNQNKRKILHHNKWLELKEYTDPEKGVEGYVYAHEKASNGKKIAVLPYRRFGRDGIEVLLRDEITPAWGMKPILSSITGSMEKPDESPSECARRELLEETGFNVEVEELRSVGTCFGSKAMDTEYHLFVVDVTGKKPRVPKGDGTELEKKAKNKFIKKVVNKEWVFDSYKTKDPIAAMLMARTHWSGKKEEYDDFEKKKGLDKIDKEERKKLIEELAEIKHEEWLDLAGGVLKDEENISDKRKKRWGSYMTDYNKLNETNKEKDRVLARRLLRVIEDKTTVKDAKKEFKYNEENKKTLKVAEVDKNKKIGFNEGDLKDHSSVAAIIKKDGKTLVFWHNKLQCWTIPVGKVENNQTVEAALREEMSSELGININSFKKLKTFKEPYTENGKNVSVTGHIFKVESFSGTPSNKEPDKHQELKYMTDEEIKGLSPKSRFLKNALPLISDKKMKLAQNILKPNNSEEDFMDEDNDEKYDDMKKRGFENLNKGLVYGRNLALLAGAGAAAKRIMDSGIKIGGFYPEDKIGNIITRFSPAFEKELIDVNKKREESRALEIQRRMARDRDRKIMHGATLGLGSGVALGAGILGNKLLKDGVTVKVDPVSGIMDGLSNAYKAVSGIFK